MTVLGTNNLSIADVIKTLDPHGDPAQIVEVLQQANGMLDDIPWQAGNLLQGNRTSVRTSLPGVTAAVANAGTTPTASGSAQIDDACAILRTQSVIDQIVAETGGKAMVPFHRANEARAHIEALGQKLADVLVYGSLAVPGEFVGFNNRFNSLSGAQADHVISGGGSGADNASILVVKWGPGRVWGIYPKGTMGGIERNDEGLTSVVDATGAAGATFPAYREYFTWRCGLAVGDWRCIVRICNIDVSNLLAKSSAADLPELLIAALEAIPNPEDNGPDGRTVIYMNRTLKKMLRIQLRDDVGAGGQLGYMEIAGKRVLAFDGFPIRTMDKMLNTEAAVA